MRGLKYALPVSLLMWLLLGVAIAKADFTTDALKWKDNGKSYGLTLCARLRDSTCDNDCKLANIYYDGAYVFKRLDGLHPGNGFDSCAVTASNIFKDYITRSGGALQVPGYRNFTDGFQVLGEYDWVHELSTKAAYARQEAFGEDITNPELSREISYAIVSYINARKGGYELNSLYNSRVNASFEHLAHWFDRGDAPYIRPFMVALTARAIIRHDEAYTDSRTLPVLRSAASWLWDNTWIPSSRAFKYTDRVVSSGGTEPAPDLNLLIAPLYYWLFAQTGEVSWRDKGDAIFEGGVNQAYFASGKQFNQNYFWTGEGLVWRSAVSPTPTPVPTATPTRTPTPCSMAKTVAAHHCRLEKLEKKL